MSWRFTSVAWVALAALSAPPASAATFSFSTGNPNGLMATGSRPPSSGKIEIESGDDFVLSGLTSIGAASFVGLIGGGAATSDISQVVVELYRVFPKDSTSPPSGNVPTRANSPSDVAFASADAIAGTLSFTATTLSASFAASNSVLNGINTVPNQTTGGEGSVTGIEVRLDVTFTPPIILPADHYFFVPQVRISTPAGNFFWLSAPKPIVSPGTPFAPDLQSWIRNENLAPDWLRIGTDIVGGATPPTFNAVFSLAGESGGAASVSATKTVAGEFKRGGAITYTVTLTNAGPNDQLDNPGHEFTDTLPADTTLVGATASSGTTGTTGNTVNWDGSIPVGSPVTITINATINSNVSGAPITNQGTVSFDADGDGTNEATAVTDDPNLPGSSDPTTFNVESVPTLTGPGLLTVMVLVLAGGLAALHRRGAALPGSDRGQARRF